MAEERKGAEDYDTEDEYSEEDDDYSKDYGSIRRWLPEERGFNEDLPTEAYPYPTLPEHAPPPKPPGETRAQTMGIIEPILIANGFGEEFHRDMEAIFDGPEDDEFDDNFTFVKKVLKYEYYKNDISDQDLTRFKTILDGRWWPDIMRLLRFEQVVDMATRWRNGTDVYGDDVRDHMDYFYDAYSLAQQVRNARRRAQRRDHRNYAMVARHVGLDPSAARHHFKGRGL